MAALEKAATSCRFGSGRIVAPAAIEVQAMESALLILKRLLHRPPSSV
jgi:hypothetical protein